MFNKQLYQKTHEGNKRILMEIQNFSNIRVEKILKINKDK